MIGGLDRLWGDVAADLRCNEAEVAELGPRVAAELVFEDVRTIVDRCPR